ncbi:hypothetical protein IQ37_13075 [Chryseobacterium piperi]|uniref:Uncharacterized protein n=1 Tax=Chryseobacterium piperi TaxID=558152 RepID=A0A086B6Z7_9FLAO|nr:hypothetical protein [Chryseobacterium piperi]ASW76219.1 hypothetical protein CJF12_19380 [Chryseobacterium piperi]KFF24711.1 hypothetical protein IQ37_13075 [Chryseobacterium piperi]
MQKCKETYKTIEITDPGYEFPQIQVNYYKNKVKRLYNKEISFEKYGLGLHVVLNFMIKIGRGIAFRKKESSEFLVEIMIKN